VIRKLVRRLKIIWLVGLPLVLVASFLASALVYVAPNEVLQLDYGGRGYGYIAERGWYLVDPWAERIEWTLGMELPTTEDYLNAALKADALADLAREVEGTANPTTVGEMQGLVDTVVEYINRRPEVAHPVILTETVYFRPDPSSESLYDTETAHYEYITGRMAINMAAFAEMARTDQNSALAVIVHELSHSALGLFTGEQLCQLLTLQVLYDMMEEDVPGATFAFYDELTSWFYLAAYSRVEFAHGWRVLSLKNSWDIEHYLSSGDYDVDRYWVTHLDTIVPVPNVLGRLWAAVRGEPYKVLLSRKPLFRPLMEWAVSTVFRLRAEGIAFVPGELAQKVGVAPMLYRLHLPPWFWHEEIVLLRGERHMLNEVRSILKASDRVSHYREFLDHLKNNPRYFARVWWAYMYGPLQLIEAWRYMRLPIRYWVWVKDPTKATNFDFALAFFFGLGMQPRQMVLEDVAPAVHRFLNLKPTPEVLRGEDGLWYVSYLSYKRVDRFVAFPLVPLLYLLLPLAYLLGRGSRKWVVRVCRRAAMLPEFVRTLRVKIALCRRKEGTDA